MKEKIAYKITFILFITFLYSMLAFKAVYVYAETDDEEESMQIDDSATNGNYDYTQYEELTQSFYIPKSSFMSSYDYENIVKECIIMDIWIRITTGLQQQQM